MRLSEGIPNGRIAELSDPEMFQEHEEVIVFTREEFKYFYTSMMEQIDYINNVDLYFDRGEEWKLIGYWPKIMDRLHLLDVNMDSLLKRETSLQTYLDASLYNAVRSIQKNVEVTKKKLPVQTKLQI